MKCVSNYLLIRKKYGINIYIEVIIIKIAVLSDIHGNIVALNKVLNDAKKNNVDTDIYTKLSKEYEKYFLLKRRQA